MDKLKYIKLENEDGSYSDSIPLAVDSDHVDVNGSTLTNELNNKATKTEVQAIASGSPLVASSTSEMTDTSRVYVNTTDGKWYYYDGDSWEIGGIYQATQISDDSVEPENTTFISGLDGINKFNKNRPGTMPYFISSTGGTYSKGMILSGNVANRIVVCKVKPNTQYNISCKLSTLFLCGETEEQPNLNVSFTKYWNLKTSQNYSDDGVIMNCPIITTEDAEYIVIQVVGSDTETIDYYLDNIQVEEGISYTGYHAYEYELDNNIKLGYKKPYDTTTVIEATINDTNIKLWIPANYTTKGIPCVIGFHGHGSGNSSWTNSSSYPDRVLIREACLNAGYMFAVAENTNSLTTWGNKVCVQTYTDLINYIEKNFTVTKYGVFANSMGGIESLNFISEKRLPIKVYVGTSLTYNLEQIYNSNLFTNTIDSAYNINGDYADKTLYKDPSKKNTSLYGSFPTYILGGTNDTSINQTYNGFKMASDFDRFAENILVQISDAGHNLDISSYMTSIMTFIAKYFNN